jgi:hypothetical protein
LPQLIERNAFVSVSVEIVKALDNGIPDLPSQWVSGAGSGSLALFEKTPVKMNGA